MSVLLGLCDDPIPGDDDGKLSPHTNKIGGSPVFMNPGTTVPECRCCSSAMSLILQTYCPLDSSPYHRVLYVFACGQKRCQNKVGSWRVLRCQRLDPGFTTAPNQRNEETAKTELFTTSDWCDDADDWGDEDDHVTVLDQSQKSMEDVTPDSPCPEGDLPRVDSDSDLSDRLSNDATESECIPEELTLPSNSEIEKVLSFKHEGRDECTSEKLACVKFKPYYLSAVEEPEPAEEVDDHVTSLLNDYERREGSIVTSSDTSGPGESYEVTKAAHGDNIFRKFVKRVARCPEQCLRYDWCGQPLRINRHSEPVDHCPVCRKKRVFEMQIMPGLLNFLKRSDSSPLTLDFGAVLIYSCEDSCWKDSDSFREEQCLIQSDPDNELFS